jgi:FixJ family two-component response regulator
MAAEQHLVAVVDDDNSVRAALGSLLRSLGYQAVLFASAEEFLAAEPEGLDCLICDIKMPGITGWVLVEGMRARGQAIPTIMITAFDEGGRRIPGVTVFKKPFDVALMAEAIKAAIHDD